MEITITQEQQEFLVALLQHQAAFYLSCSNDKFVQVNQRITNDLLYQLDKPKIEFP